MKQITIADITIKEIHFAKDSDSYVISVLYAQKDSDGKEYDSKWADPIKGDDLPNGIILSLDGVFTRVKNKIIQLEGL